MPVTVLIPGRARALPARPAKASGAHPSARFASLTGALLIALNLVAACGGKKHPAATIGSGGARDAAVAQDAGNQQTPVAPPPKDAPKTTPHDPTPVVDAGHDAGHMPVTQPDEDAGPHCTARECQPMGDDCNVASCDAATGECKLARRPDNTPCGSQILDNCTKPDTCQAGVCVPNDYGKGTPCGDSGKDCLVDDQCDGHGQCMDNGVSAQGTACGDPSDSACDKPDTCDDQGVCLKNYATVGAACGDQGKLCNFDDTCDGQGQCTDNGVWTLGHCPSGKSKDSVGGCLCGGEILSECRFAVEVCKAGACVGNEPDGKPCGDKTTDTECNKPDSCLSGNCVPNYAASGAPCGDRTTDTACDRPDACDGTGRCDPQYASTTTACGSAAGECFVEPLCNGSGSCRPTVPAASGTICGSQVDTECDHADTCDNSGVCKDNLAASGAACGNQGLACANNDSCNGAGTCIDHGVISPCMFSGTVFGGNSGLAGVLVGTLGNSPVTTTTDSNGRFQLALPLLQEIVLHVGDTTGYFGNIELRTLTPQDAQHPLEFYPSSDANLNATASAVALSLNASKGAVLVTIDGSTVSGGEGATLSAASASPITMVGSAWQYSNTIMSSPNGFLLYYNVAPGTTTVSPMSAAGETCTVDATSLTQFPVLAHTLTNVHIACN